MEHFLTPVLALILWTFVIWAWMYKRRIPAMMAITRNTQEFIDNPKLKEKIPPRARWAADNYNHLHEQPVIFYALMFYLNEIGLVKPWLLVLAWIYVATRILHSLVQVSSNKVMLRFPLFAVGTLILIGMGIYAAGYAIGTEMAK